MNRKQLNTSKIPGLAVAAVAAVAASFVLPAAHAQKKSSSPPPSGRRVSQSGGPAARTGRMNRSGSTMPQSGGVNGTNTTGSGNGSSSGVSRSGNRSASGFSVTAANVPGAVEPIMNRAALLLRVAEVRQNSAPGGAKESYRASAQALRQLLSSAHLSPGLGSGNGLASAPPVSSTQVGDDIRTLRASAKSSRGSQMTMLNQAASLYATGTKEFFTAQLREALFDTNVTTAPVVIRGNRTGAAGQATRSGGSSRRRGNGSTQQGGVIGNAPVGNADVAPNNNSGPFAPGVGLETPGVTVLGGGSGTVGTPGVIAPGTVNTGPVIVTPVPPVQPGTPPQQPVPPPVQPANP